MACTLRQDCPCHWVQVSLLASDLLQSNDLLLWLCVAHTNGRMVVLRVVRACSFWTVQCFVCLGLFCVGVFFCLVAWCFTSARCRACLRLVMSDVSWRVYLGLFCFVFNVTDVIEPGAIAPHPLPSIGFPCQNHLPSVVLPRALSTHAFRVLPNTIALVQVMPVISYQLSDWYFKPFDISIP